MHPYAKGDDSGRIEEDFLMWKQDLWKHWYKVLPDIHELPAAEDHKPPQPVQGAEGGDWGKGRLVTMPPAQAPALPAYYIHPDFNFKRFSQSQTCNIVGITELRQAPTDILSTIQIDIKLPPDQTYQTAGNIMIYPRNTKEAVFKMLGYLEADGDRLVCLNPSWTQEEAVKTPLQFPLNKPLRKILAKFIDIKGPIK